MADLAASPFVFTVVCICFNQPLTIKLFTQEILTLCFLLFFFQNQAQLFKKSYHLYVE